MEDKIFDIVTDLIREDITKNEAIDKLLILYDECNRENNLQKLTDQAQDLDLGYD